MNINRMALFAAAGTGDSPLFTGSPCPSLKNFPTYPQPKFINPIQRSRLSTEIAHYLENTPEH
jgi:hypothetical protein